MTGTSLLRVEQLTKVFGTGHTEVVAVRDVDLLATWLDALEAREGSAAGSTRILTIATESAAAVLALTAKKTKSVRRDLSPAAAARAAGSLLACAWAAAWAASVSP